MDDAAPETPPVAWTYRQRSGLLSSPDGKYHVTGYSGCGEGLNNPDMQEDAGVGPIPRGLWQIYLTPLDMSHGLGPLAFPLLPGKGTDTFGRSLFRIHGDNAEMDHSASHGCIVVDHNTRQLIKSTGCTNLLVIEE